MTPFVETLYEGGSAMRSIRKALDDDGILSAHVGESAQANDPAESLAVDKNRANFVGSLVESGFEGIRDYDEVSLMEEGVARHVGR